MSTEIDWQRELDSSFGDGRDVPAGHYVAAGRSAVRRRRAAAAVIISAAVVLVGGVVWSTSPGSTPRSEAPLATQGPAPDRSAGGSDAETRRERRLGPEELQSTADQQTGLDVDFVGNPATLTDDGLVLAPGAGPVLQSVADPMDQPARAGRSSIGLRVMFEGEEKYSLVTYDNGSTSLHTEPATGNFAGWLADKVRIERSLDLGTDDSPADVTATPDAWLKLAPAGTIASASPFVAVRETREVDLGGGFALESDRTGVARLQVTGLSEYVAWRVVDDELEVVHAGGRFESLDAFVEWARRQYASGEGMR
ncbi:hypothetical protein GCM10009641_76530 [Mycobacterium cookii]|uniref:DUF2092 domain-containing protein n=1 Tax=Nocardioides furvisabuli TaxID=375542 RepID=A0ABN2XJC8_9ACTN|nr:hypothetical protein [Nocardioides furvisabuli]